MQHQTPVHTVHVWHHAQGPIHATAVQAFTEAVIVPSCGYSSVDDSWDASNGLRWIPSIATPTMLVSARDDPFLHPEYASCCCCPFVRLFVCKVQGACFFHHSAMRTAAAL